MLKVGDGVRIVGTEYRDSYKQILNKVGKIAQITKFKHFEDDREHTKYYVEIPEFRNEYQSEGLWIFYDEMSIAPTTFEVSCDWLDASVYATEKMVDWGNLILNGNQHKGDNYMKILEIYKERRTGKINKKYDDMIEAVKQSDPRYKVWKECVDKLSELYEEDKILTTEHFAPINLSNEVLKKIKTIHNTRCEEFSDLSDKVNEVQAQLSMCETYEQKQDILRTYKIIKENGKVNA